MSLARRGRYSILGAGALVAAGLGVAAAGVLGERAGPGVLLPASLGYGLAVAATLGGLAIQTRGGSPLALLRGVGLGFLAKLVLLAGGTLAVWLSAIGSAEAYVLAFVAGILVAGAAGVLHVWRAFPAGGSATTGGSNSPTRV